MSKKIAVVVGSLRKDSLNRKLANQLASLAPSSISLKIIEIADLAVFNSDLDDEGKTPASWTRFRNEMKACDGVLFVTPEYNRSIPGCLKNAIDVGSRPYGQSIWKGKPGAVISLSPGAIGGFGANHHLRQTLVFLDVPTLQQPEAYLSKAGEMFTAKDEIADPETSKFLHGFMEVYASWVEKNL